jgi:hypothetical protein
MRDTSRAVLKTVVAMLGAAACAAAQAEQPILREIAAAPDPAQLQATVTALVGFGTRHTLSDTQGSKRGIGAARRWAQARFETIGRDCGGCLSIVTPSQTFTGERLPKPAEVVDVVAIQKGSSDPERVIVLTGHIDSRVTDPMNATADAPGADDDASGVAAVIEAARILSRYKFPATLVYGVLSGEEQGLYGGRVLAEYAKAQHWRLEADLNNDIVGASRGQNGIMNNTRVRVFSEGTRDTETPEDAKERRYEGGENDSASRNVARYAKAVAEAYLPNWTVALVYRLDRFGRGGDHSAFNALGYPAVRFTENAENYRIRTCAPRAGWSMAMASPMSISRISPRSPPPMRSRPRPWRARRRPPRRSRSPGKLHRIPSSHGARRPAPPRRGFACIGATPRIRRGRMLAMPAPATRSPSRTWPSMISSSAWPAFPRMASRARWSSRAPRGHSKARASKGPVRRILRISSQGFSRSAQCKA